MLNINFNYLLRQIIGKPTCVKHANARLGVSARITNIGQHSSQITIGAGTIVDGQLLVFPHGGRITLGEWCYVGEGTRIWSAVSIEIGDRVMISHNVNIFDSLTHPLSAALRHQQFRKIATVGHPRNIDLGEKPVRIGNDAWIAAGAMVLRGVTVGEGAIVGAGAVVTRDVAPWTIVAGNPARRVRELNPAERGAGKHNKYRITNNHAE